RGASSAALVGVGAVEALLVWTVGAVAGTGAAWVCARLLWHVSPWWVAGSAVGLAVTLLAVLRPVVADARRLTIGEARRTIGALTRGRPLRTTLAWAIAAVAAVVVWFTTRETYQIVVAPEGVPSISVSYLSLAGPAMAG